MLLRLRVIICTLCDIFMSVNKTCFLGATGVPEETGPQTLPGCIPAEACTEDHQIPANA